MGDIGVSKDALRAVIPLTGEFVGTTDTQTITTKTINTTDNTITATSQAAGDILVNNATKFVRLARGAANLPLHTNSGGTDIEYTKLEVSGGGTGATTLTGILKGAGTSAITAVAAPTGTILGDSDVQNITGGKTFYDQTFKVRNLANTATMTFHNPSFTGDQDTVWNFVPSILIFKDADDSNKYKAKSGTSSRVFSTDTTDCSIVLQAAIDSLSATGGEIKFARGTYVFLTAVTCITSGIQIRGESRATKWTVTPGSALTNFFTFGSCLDCKFRDIWIQANTNVTNIIHAYTSNPASSCNRGEISGCLIDGTTNTTGHTGIWMDGTLNTGVGAVYQWNIYKNTFLNEDIGIKCTPPNSNGQYIYGNTFATCNTGIDIIDTDEHHLWGNFGQGLITAVVHLNNNSGAGAAQYNIIQSTQGDGGTCPVVLIDSGCKFNVIQGVIETGGTRITDNSAQKNFCQPGTLITSHSNVTLAGSPHTYLNVDGYPETVYVIGGIVTDISIKRESTTASVYTDTDKSVRLDSGDSVIVTYPVSSQAPTVKVVAAG